MIIMLVSVFRFLLFSCCCSSCVVLCRLVSGFFILCVKLCSVVDSGEVVVVGLVSVCIFSSSCLLNGCRFRFVCYLVLCCVVRVILCSCSVCFLFSVCCVCVSIVVLLVNISVVGCLTRLCGFSVSCLVSVGFSYVMCSFVLIKVSLVVICFVNGC